MGQHEKYGKCVLKKAVDDLSCELNKDLCFKDSGNEVRVSYRNSEARIDGIVKTNDNQIQIAVEIESRTEKQIRGAIIDLYFHPYSKKLLVIIPAHQADSQKAKSQCEYILSELRKCKDFKFEVVLLEFEKSKELNKELIEQNKKLIKQAIKNLIGN